MDWNHKRLPDLQLYKIIRKPEWILKFSEFYYEGVCKIYCGFDDKPNPLTSEFGESAGTENYILYECLPWSQKRLRDEQPEWHEVFDKFITENILKRVEKL